MNHTSLRALVTYRDHARHLSEVRLLDLCTSCTTLLGFESSICQELSQKILLFVLSDIESRERFYCVCFMWPASIAFIAYILRPVK